jgi:hypothetical protein
LERGSNLGIAYTDLAVRGSIDNVRDLVQTAFGAQGFEVDWMGPTQGKADRGGRGMSIALGALAQYFGVGFQIAPTRDGAVVRLIKSDTGWSGGYLAARKVKKKVDEVSDLLASWFHEKGVFLGQRKG